MPKELNVDKFIESLNEETNIEDLVEKRIDQLLEDFYQNKREFVLKRQAFYATLL